MTAELAPACFLQARHRRRAPPAGREGIPACPLLRSPRERVYTGTPSRDTLSDCLNIDLTKEVCLDASLATPEPPPKTTTMERVKVATH